ncbi:MAG: ABC transporter permease subunit [Deltaproteobacteria bacterium]|nr:ABC transporter permease subunit [Deltaproteobacteria bacterium]
MMRNIYPILKKEMRSYFNSSIAYVVIAAFLIISGWFFYTSMAFFNMISFQAMQNPYLRSQLNIMEMVVRPLFSGNLTVLLVILLPAVTMRLFAEEKKSGTIELLLTYPVSDFAVLMGKYLSSLGVFIAMLILTGLYPLVIYWLSQPEWGVLVSVYLGLLLMGGSFLALGLFASSLTENQIVAFVIGIAASLFFWIIGWASTFTGGFLKELLLYLSVTHHFNNFRKGVIDTADLAFYVIFIVFFLFCTLRVLESKRWKG